MIFLHFAERSSQLWPNDPRKGESPSWVGKPIPANIVERKPISF